MKSPTHPDRGPLKIALVAIACVVFAILLLKYNNMQETKKIRRQEQIHAQQTQIRLSKLLDDTRFTKDRKECNYKNLNVRRVSGIDPETEDKLVVWERLDVNIRIFFYRKLNKDWFDCVFENGKYIKTMSMGEFIRKHFSFEQWKALTSKQNCIVIKSFST